MLVPGDHFHPVQGEWFSGAQCLFLDTVIFRLSLTDGIFPCGLIFPIKVQLSYSVVWFSFGPPSLVILLRMALLC